MEEVWMERMEDRELEVPWFLSAVELWYSHFSEDSSWAQQLPILYLQTWREILKCLKLWHQTFCHGQVPQSPRIFRCTLVVNRLILDTSLRTCSPFTTVSSSLYKKVLFTVWHNLGIHWNDLSSLQKCYVPPTQPWIHNDQVVIRQ